MVVSKMICKNVEKKRCLDDILYGDWFCSTNIIVDAIISKILQPVLTDSYFLGKKTVRTSGHSGDPHLTNHS